MRRTVVALLAVLLVLGVLDFAWLSTMVPRVYRPLIGDLLAGRPVWSAAIGFYLLYAVGLLVLVVRPALGREGGAAIREAALRGGLLGLVAYGTYDLTNLATLRDWPLSLTAIDMAWGTVLTASSAAVAVWAARRLG